MGFAVFWCFLNLGFSGFVRLPVEASCLLTMLPLHSAIASARLQSVLSVDSQSWCLVPQGTVLCSIVLCF